MESNDEAAPSSWGDLLTHYREAWTHVLDSPALDPAHVGQVLGDAYAKMLEVTRDAERAAGARFTGADGHLAGELASLAERLERVTARLVEIETALAAAAIRSPRKKKHGKPWKGKLKSAKGKKGREKDSAGASER